MCQNETQEGWQCSVLATPQTLGHAVEAEQRLAILGDEKKYQTKSGLEGAL